MSRIETTHYCSHKLKVKVIEVTGIDISENRCIQYTKVVYSTTPYAYIVYTCIPRYSRITTNTNPGFYPLKGTGMNLNRKVRFKEPQIQKQIEPFFFTFLPLSTQPGRVIGCKLCQATPSEIFNVDKV